jgi:hypothetical protein
MKFNSHTEMNNGNALPNSLITPKFGLKTGGGPFDNITENIGNVVQSVTENTKNVGSTLQGHFNRFLNNPMFSSNDSKTTTTATNEIKESTPVMPSQSLNNEINKPLNTNNVMIPKTKALSNANSVLPSNPMTSKIPAPTSFTDEKQETAPTPLSSDSIVGGKKHKKRSKKHTHKKTKKHLGKNKKHIKHHKKTQKHKNRSNKNKKSKKN